MKRVLYYQWINMIRSIKITSTCTLLTVDKYDKIIKITSTCTLLTVDKYDKINKNHINMYSRFSLKDETLSDY